MSYAEVTSINTSGYQPSPDQGLLNTEVPSASPVVDDTSKLNIVPHDFSEHPRTTTGEKRKAMEDEAKEDVKKYKNNVHEEGYHILELAKKYVGRPGVLGGLLGVVNVGLLFGVARTFYKQPALRSNYGAIGATIAAALAIIGVEGFGAERYAQTPRGKREAENAKKEGTILYRHAQEIVLRPGVLGGLVGLVNTAVLGGVGYYAFKNWDRPTWDRHTVSAVCVGILTLVGGEGLLAERYRQSHH